YPLEEVRKGMVLVGNCRVMVCKILHIDTRACPTAVAPQSLVQCEGSANVSLIPMTYGGSEPSTSLPYVAVGFGLCLDFDLVGFFVGCRRPALKCPRFSTS